MGDQLSLGIKQKLRMDPPGFFLHEGVKDVLPGISGGSGFRFVFVQGDKYSGKSHASIWLAEQMARRSAPFIELLSGENLDEWLESSFHEESLCSGSCYIIDDVDAYFMRRTPGESASFVRFYEAVKRADSRIVCFSTCLPENFPCDEHIMSRLHSAESFVIGSPGEADLPSMLEALARQRGLDLGERKTRYAEARVGRNISAMVAFLDRLQRDIQNGEKASFANISEAL